MLTITLPAVEDAWDENKQEFVSLKQQTLQLEHSLVAISKWEAKWHKAFLTHREKTIEETIDYIKCMTVSKNVDPNVYLRLTSEHLKAINEYIEDPMTATVLPKDSNTGKAGRDTPTSELIYSWMIALHIPIEFQKWHLNRLITLIKVCELKNTPPKKMSQGEIAKRHAAINRARRKKH